MNSFDSANPNAVFSDDYGKVYVRRGLLGSPALYADGLASVTIRGGMPLVRVGIGHGARWERNK